MAGSAVIGALRVNLGLDTAQFSAGLKASQASLAKFGKNVAVGFAAVATAAAAAGVAMGVAVKGAIDHADAMSKAAQKAGTTTEALSRLAYAADFSDVSLEQLTGGLGRLSKTMLEVAGGSKGPAATAFKALGIAVTDAAGNLRNSDAVFADIAERFSQLENGTTKTSLAIALFGRAGADLIPLLNEGSDGLKRFADESDRTGNTISTNTGRAAEAFNDQLTAIQKSLNGVVNRMTQYLLPSMQEIATFMASPEFAAAAQGFGEAIASGVKVALDVVVGLSAALKDLFSYIASKAAQGASPLDNIPITQLEARIANTKRILADPGNAGQDMKGLEKTLAEEMAALNRRKFTDPLGNGASFSDVLGLTFGTSSTNTKTPPGKTPVDFDALVGGAKAASSAVTDLMAGVDDAQPKVENFAKTIGDSLAGAFSSFADSVLSGVPAVEALSDVLGDLGKQLLNSAITGFFGNLFGGGFSLGGFKGSGGGPANLLNVGSFAGGGYTGNGSRSGGVDGMGGFPAILHPNETVVDHAAGQSLGGGTSRVLVQMDQGLIGKILQQAHQDAVQVVKTTSPAAVATAQRDKWLG